MTDVEHLFRSPYDLYAKYTLRLNKLAPLGEAPDARDRHLMTAGFLTMGACTVAFAREHGLLAQDRA